MPIYEYQCNNCQNEFEKLVFSKTAAIECPKCQSTSIQKKISKFSFKSQSSDYSAPASSATSACGSCSSSNCSSCK